MKFWKLSKKRISMELSIYLLKSVTVLSIFYVVYYFFLRKDTLFTAKRHYLLSGILASLFLPFLEFTKTIYRELRVLEMSPFSEVIPSTAQAITQQQEAFTINWWQVALVVYAIGVLIMGGRLLFQIFSLLKLIRTYPSEKINQVNFVRIDENISPFSFFKYIIYNPSLHTKEELQMILKHEKVHASQWHSVDIIVANVARILQWVNPLSWFYKKSLEENLEFIADNETASRVPSKKQYQLALIKASSPLLAPALTTQFYQSFIKKRIIMLNKNTSKRQNIWKLSIVLPVLALFLWSFNVKEVVEYKELISPETFETAVNPAETIPDYKFGEIPLAEEESIDKTPVIKKEGSDIAKSHSVNKTIENESRPMEIVVSSERTLEDPVKEFRFQITKNTTDAELESMKNELKRDHDIDLVYSVERNSNNEITSISLSYTGDGNSGSYNISDDGPIEDFQFYMNDDGRSGFYSERQEIRRKEREVKRVKEMEKRKVEREVRRADMKERRVEMEGRRKEMDERRVEMEVRKSNLAKRMEGEKMRTVKREKEMKERYKESAKAYGRAKARSNSRNNTFIFSSDDDNVFESAIRIDKDTTDERLNEIKTKLNAEGSTFNYSKVKRNAAGEITRIKITTDNGRGSKSTIEIHGDDGEPIDEILIQI